MPFKHFVGVLMSDCDGLIFETRYISMNIVSTIYDNVSELHPT
jgi:hypothetical protein